MAKKSKEEKAIAKLEKQIEELTQQLEEKEAENLESKDKHLRLYAEFENFRKRTNKERLELMSTAAESTLKSLLPVLDDFDRAKSSADNDESVEQFSEGVQLVYDKLKSNMATLGLVSMESTHEVFDPELHEAVTDIPAPTEDLKGKVIDTIEKGYKLNDKIIRYAKVVVGK